MNEFSTSAEMQALGYFHAPDANGASLAEQSGSFLEFCRQNGYEPVATFLDTAAASGDHNGYGQLLDFLRQQNRGFMIVAVVSLRDLDSELIKAVRRYFQLTSLGVKVIAMGTGKDAGTNLLETWAAGQGEESLAGRVRAAMRKKAIKGEVLGRPPYGYKVGPRRRLEIMPEEGAVIRFIFRLYLKDGLGIRQIARRLNEEGLPTRRGGLWSMVTVRDILRNRAYIGTYRRFGVRVPASHPPIIAQADFQLVQERLDQRRPSAQKREMVPFLLSGLAYCAYCGNKMIGVTRKQHWQRRSDGVVCTAQYRYYQCGSRTNRSLCDYHTRRAEELETEVRRGLLNSKEPVPTVVPGEEAGTSAQAETQIRRLHDKMRRLDKRLQLHLESASNGRISSERLWSFGLNLAAEQLATELSLAEASHLVQQQASRAERLQHSLKLSAQFRNEWEALSFSQRQEILRELLDRVVVWDDKIDVILRATTS